MGKIVPLDERFWSKVDASGDCWEWTAARSQGYGTIKIDGRAQKAHRIGWELLVGRVPDGLDLDHLCRNTACVNPDHLEPVARAVNVVRGYGACSLRHRNPVSACKQGHAFDEANTYLYKGMRHCRQCGRDRSNAWKRQGKAGA